MDTLQKVLDDFKNVNSSMDYIETINHIDDDICNDIKPWTILMSACQNGHIDIVKRCIRFGADVNKVDCNDSPPLYLALLLHYFYKTIQLNIAKILFKAGADPNKKIKRGNTIMPMIFYLNNDIGIKELIKYGALINEFYKYKEIIKEFMDPETCHYFIKVLAKRRWVYLKCVVLILGIHKRAVVTANHPDRLKQQGVFELEI